MNKLDERHRSKLKFHLREDWFAMDQANGNHLLYQFAIRNPGYDIYAQAFVTAVSLPGKLIKEALQNLSVQIDEYDSLLLVTRENGWVWFEGKAINYDPNLPDGLPRSQDAQFYLETTGLYAITRDSLLRNGTRIGRKPLFFEVPSVYAIDIDTMEDFEKADIFLKNRIIAS